MSGSTQDQIFQVEKLLRSVSATQGAFQVEQAAAIRSWSFDSRPLIAACFTIFVLAPGCAAATVFLMRADGNIPPIVAPDSNPPVVLKSDRLPLEQWGVEAAERLSAKDTARLAATAMADTSFLSPILIRGSLEDGTLTSFTEPAAAPEPITSPPRPRLKHSTYRVRPIKLVTELAQAPESPPPSFLEKLFGPRFH